MPEVMRAYAAFKQQDLARILIKQFNASDVIVRATAAELLGELPADESNTRALIDALPRLTPADRCIIAPGLLKRWSNESQSDWRTWNWSRARARKLVRDRSDALLAACPNAAKEQHHDH